MSDICIPFSWLESIPYLGGLTNLGSRALLGGFVLLKRLNYDAGHGYALFGSLALNGKP